MAKHKITKFDERNLALINDNFEWLSKHLTLDNFAGQQVNTGTVIINKNVIQSPIIVNKTFEAGTVNRICVPGDDIQAAIDEVAVTGGIVSLRNGLYTLDYDIYLKSSVYLEGETAEGVILDFVDNTHGIKLVGTNEYLDGTVEVAAGDTEVVGTDTLWEENIAPGQFILLQEQWYLVTEITDDTHLTIELPYSGSSLVGNDYVIASVITDANLKNLTILNADYGIYCKYTRNEGLDTFIIALCGAGIYVESSANLTITNCQTYACGQGIALAGAHLFEIKTPGISASQLGDGLYLYGCSSGIITSGYVYAGITNGVNIDSCYAVSFSGTVFTNTEDGIYLKDSLGVSLNTISVQENGGYGVNIDGAIDTIINGGVLSSNASGELNDLGLDTMVSASIGVGNKNINSILPDQTDNGGKVLKTDGTDVSWQDETGGITEEEDPVFSSWLATTPPAYPGDIPTATSELTNDSGFITAGDIPTIPDQLSDLSDDSTHRLVTDTEKSTWNSKAAGDHNHDGVYAPVLGADDNYVTDAEKANLHAPHSDDQDLSGLALKSNVLEKDNTSAFTPDADYEPATKKYVDDAVTAGGGYTDEQAQDAVGAMVTGNTESGITVTYDDASAKLNFSVASQTDNNFTTALKDKLDGIEAGAEVNNISDANATDLTDSGATTLHKHSYDNLDDKPTTWGNVTSDIALGGNHVISVLANKGTLLTLTLSAGFVAGDMIRITGVGAGGWKLQLPAGDVLHFGNLDTSSGGYIQSTHQRDSIEIVCVSNDAEWNVISSMGNITVA